MKSEKTPAARIVFRRHHEDTTRFDVLIGNERVGHLRGPTPELRRWGDERWSVYATTLACPVHVTGTLHQAKAYARTFFRARVAPQKAANQGG